MTFDTVVPGWTPEQWQGMQLRLWTELVGHLEAVRQQSATTHVFLVMCAEFKKLNEAIGRAAVAAKHEETRLYTKSLQEPLEALVDPIFGSCSSDR